MPSLSLYLIISAILFSLGLFGVITRRNGVAVLMSVELILNAANINFIAFARFGGMDFSGQEHSFLILNIKHREKENYHLISVWLCRQLI